MAFGAVVRQRAPSLPREVSREAALVPGLRAGGAHESARARAGELEARCTRLAASEERLLESLRQLRQKLEASRRENLACVEAAEREIERFQGELRASEAVCEDLEGKIRADADGELAAPAVQEEDAPRRAASEAGALREGAVRQLQQKLREVERLRAEAGARAEACEAMAREAAPLEQELERDRQRERRLLQAQAIGRRLLLRGPGAWAFQAHAAGARCSRALRERGCHLAERRRRRQCARASAAWSEWAHRQGAIRRTVRPLARCTPRRVLLAWAAQARIQARLAPRARRWSSRLLLLQRPLLPRWAAAARAAAAWRGRREEQLVRRALLARGWARWRQVLRRPSCVRHRSRGRLAALLAGGRRLRPPFAEWRAAALRGARERQFGSWFRRRLLLRRGLRRLALPLHAERLRLFLRRAAMRRLRGSGLEALLAWHAAAARQHQLRSSLAGLGRSSQALRARELLRLGFRGMAAWRLWGARVASLRGRVARASSVRLLREGALAAWRGAARQASALARLGAERRRLLLRGAVAGWASARGLVQRLRQALSERAAGRSRRLLAASWAAWLRAGAAARRRGTRGGVVAARQSSGACRAALVAWRSRLRVRARVRKAAAGLPRGGRAAEAAPREGGAGAPGGGDDPGWFGLVDALHHAARDAAEGSVALSDAQEQQGALRRALAEERRRGEALRQQLEELRDASQDESAQAGHNALVLEEELSKVLEEHAALRGALRRAGERAEADRAAALLSEQRGVELGRRLQEARQVCAELVEDRQRRFVELQARNAARKDDVARLQEALEQRRAMAQLAQAELEQAIRQRRESLAAAVA